MTAEPRWALILGASSGFGAAMARRFAAEGYGIIGVHLDRRHAMPAVESLVAELRATGAEVRFFNENAAADDRRAEIIAAVQSLIPAGSLRVLVHSLAFGTLRPFLAAPDGGGRPVSRRQLDMTLDVMAHSLVYWTRDAVSHGLMGEGGRVFAMTSTGSHLAMASYGPVSAAKAALEAHIRQLSLELAPYRITANAIMAGVCDTPALRKIPGADEIKAKALSRNPYGRLTTPEDVADCVWALAQPSTYWMTGNTIRVDGGEDCSG